MRPRLHIVAMTILDSSLVRGAGSDRLAGHDKILIVDFGSQVTQLIARRVREEKVYCEIVPFQKADEALQGDAAQGRDPVGRTGLGARPGCAACPAGDLRGRRAGARHLLRRAGDGAAARRQGRGRASPRVRPRRGAGDRGLGAVRRRVAQRRKLSGLDEPRRPRHPAAARASAWSAPRPMRRSP